MQWEAARPSDPLGEPSLAEMTEKAIEMLRKDCDGYFLYVECECRHQSLMHNGFKQLWPDTSFNIETCLNSILSIYDVL